MQQPAGRRTASWRNYPPVAAVVGALVLALAVLPSALTLPQSSPSTTLEYAPVPPADEDAPPAVGGNLSSLGLGTSSTVGIGDLDGAAPAVQAVGVGVGKNPSTKLCVGRPPRQTEDELSPPCVAYFEGDNGGNTYRGITKDEIRILFFNDDVSCSNCSRGVEGAPTNVYQDLWLPPQGEEYVETRTLRVWQTYFNARYQTYGRRVHFYVYYGDTKANTTAQRRRAQAADNFARIKPFAVVPNERGVQYGYISEYAAAMAAKGVMVFESHLFEPAENFADFAPLIWGYRPSLEQQARSFASYVCQKVAGTPVTFSGDAAANGGTRKYGLVYTTDPSTNFPRFKDEVVAQVRKCGVSFAAEATFPHHGSSANASGSGYASPQMASFRQNGITTVIQMGGVESNFSKAAGALQYHPEWVVAGDGFVEGPFQAAAQEQTVYGNTVAVTPTTREYSQSTFPECTNAFNEVTTDWSDVFADIQIACQDYAAIRQLFSGIQVAGPRLTPAAVDKGFHAIPRHTSSNPNVPACFYEPGEYTCTKDATVVWWDPSAPASDNPGYHQAVQGCWRMMEGGRRYLAGAWSNGDVTAQRTPSDPCDGHQWVAAVDEYPGG